MVCKQKEKFNAYRDECGEKVQCRKKFYNLLVRFPVENSGY